MAKKEQRVRESGFDYEVEHTCRYDVSDTNEPCDCGEPAPYKVWWGNSPDVMWLCSEHFNRIHAIETEQPTPQPQEELTEEQRRELGIILCTFATKFKLEFPTLEIVDEAIAKLRTLGYSSPQEAKEQVKQARGEIGEALEFAVGKKNLKKSTLHKVYISTEFIEALKGG